MYRSEKHWRQIPKIIDRYILRSIAVRKYQNKEITFYVMTSRRVSLRNIK